MKKAFTLIELLVVIAIIAILAAILFPVFAQAKAAAKKTASLSNIKQHGTAMAMYEADADDNMPSALRGGGVAAPTPTSDFNIADPVSLDQANSYWGSTVQPYLKNYDIMMDPSMAALKADPSYPERLKKFSYSFNGYLHLMSATSIVSPARTTLFWMGAGANKMYGYSHSYPQPRGLASGFPSAATQGAYRFQRSGADCGLAGTFNLGAAVQTNLDYRTYGGSSLFTYADGHAKAVNVKSNDFPFILDPTTGRISQFWVDSTDSAAGCSYFEVLSPLRD